MLVLSRKVGEEIIVNGNVTIRIVAGKGNRVAIAIDAPPEVSILRGELQEEREEEYRIVFPDRTQRQSA